VAKTRDLKKRYMGQPFLSFCQPSPVRAALLFSAVGGETLRLRSGQPKVQRTYSTAALGNFNAMWGATLRASSYEPRSALP